MPKLLSICVLLASVAVSLSQKVGVRDEESDRIKYNGALPVDEDFSIIFNILLWVGISLGIATLSICVFIASMDPGRDSLIYRVTSGQRLKKDN